MQVQVLLCAPYKTRGFAIQEAGRQTFRGEVVPVPEGRRLYVSCEGGGVVEPLSSLLLRVARKMSGERRQPLCHRQVRCHHGCSTMRARNPQTRFWRFWREGILGADIDITHPQPILVDTLWNSNPKSSWNAAVIRAARRSRACGVCCAPARS